MSESARADGAERPDEAYRLTLPGFEGPLDLLLHLIQQHELDILDIPIGFVAQKYNEYLALMGELNIDVAAEYLVMAATLIHIKSRMLVPSSAVDDDDQGMEVDPDEDPRAELVRRLLEYQKYRAAADELGERSVLGRDVFGRGAPLPADQGPAPLAPLGVFKLLEAFQTVLERARRTVEHEVDLERFSITDRINSLVDQLTGRGRVAFESLFAEGESRAELIVTFLALLEMTKLRMLHIEQDEPLAPIFITLTLAPDRDDTADVGERGVGDAETPAGDREPQ